MHKRTPAVVSTLVMSLLLGLHTPCQSAPAAAASQSDEAAVKAKLSLLQDAVIKADAKAMTSLFTEDGHYIDETGTEASGQKNLESAFADAMKENGKPNVQIAADSIRFPAPGVAVVTGVVKRAFAGDITMPVNKYSITMVKKTGQWLISSATETPIVAVNENGPALFVKLGDWLSGDWKAERDGATVKMTANWTPSKNFIFCRYEIQTPGIPLKVETQVIGWDPQNNTPISWHFNSDGGYGQSTWHASPGIWMIDTTEIEPDGATTSATNIIDADSDKSFTWKSNNRRVNGMVVGNAVPLKVERVVK